MTSRKDTAKTVPVKFALRNKDNGLFFQKIVYTQPNLFPYGRCIDSQIQKARLFPEEAAKVRPIRTHYEWTPLWEVDEIQFARLITGISDVGGFGIIDSECEGDPFAHLELGRQDVSNIISRAFSFIDLFDKHASSQEEINRNLHVQKDASGELCLLHNNSLYF